MRRLIVIAMLCAGCAAYGQVLNLRTSTSVYGWQRYDTISQSSNHYRGYEAVNFDLSQGLWRLSASGYVSNDFGAAQSQDPLLRLYNVYISGTNIGGLLDARVGRVPVFMGTGATTIDGGALKLHFAHDRYALALAGGGAVQNTNALKMFSNVSDNLFLGAQAVARIAENGRVGISYVRMVNTPPPDSIVADTSNVLHNVLFKPAQERIERADIDAGYALLDQKLDLYGRGDYDIPAKSLARLELSARYAFSRQFTAGAEYFQREALLAYNSFFSVFDHGDYKEATVSAMYMPSQFLSCSFYGGTVKYSGGSALRGTLAGRWKGLSAAVIGQSGDEGKQAALTIEENYALSSLFTLTGGLGFTSYSFAGADSTQTSLAVVLGGSVRPSAVFSADAQVQFLRNAIYANDTRIFVRANWWLFERF